MIQLIILTLLSHPKLYQVRNSSLETSNLNSPLNVEVTFPILIKYFERAPDWKKVAAFLLNDKDGSKCESIARSKANDVSECSAEVARELMKSGDVTWQHVLKSLRDAEYMNLADQIVEDLGLKSKILYSCMMCD